MTLAVGVRELWVPRRGNHPDEYEDASAAAPPKGRFALADGATESSFAAAWARLLVEDFVQAAGCDFDAWKSRLPLLQKQWYASVQSPSLSWNAEAKLEQGAFATFLGITIDHASDGNPVWQATAVGDTCLFHTRGAELLDAFPLAQSNKFNNAPPLLGSRMSPQTLARVPVAHARGEGRSGDCLWMMTDALAQWCLREHEIGNHPWREIEALFSQQDADRRSAAWIDELRTSRRLHNDDVTLLWIVLEKAGT